MLAGAPRLSARLVAIAASAGGLQALTRLLGALPRDFPATMAVVQHLERHGPSLLAPLLERRCAFAVREARHGEPLAPGLVLVGRPDYHLLVNVDGTVSLTHTELVHFVRPSADLLFESAAGAFGARAIAVVLSGSGTDGAMGVTAIRKRGGTVIVQDPASAEYRGMPDAALRTGCADHVLPLDEIAPALVRLAALPAA